MIYKDFDREGSSFKLRMPLLEVVDNSYKFLIIDLIVALYLRVFLRVKGNWVEDALIIILGQDPYRDIV